MAVLCATLGLGLLLPAHPDGATAPALRLAPATRPVAPTTAPATALAASPPVRITIPALGVASDVMRLGLQDDGSLEVPPAAYPAGWYDGGPTPGEPGPAVLAGHVDWAGVNGVFHDIGALRPGDRIAVAREDGTTATFAVDRVVRVAKAAFPSDEVYGPTDRPELRLITCGGPFDAASGNYLDNVVVFASLAPPT
jgi:hypothetical protein